MPPSPKMGTAWTTRLDDYAYTRALDRPGWAWEFLRRNQGYRRDWRLCQAGLPNPIRHTSGAVYFRLRRRFLRAEVWGLVMFSNPSLTAKDTGVFWHPTTHNRMVSCSAAPANDSLDNAVGLEDFCGKRQVLAVGEVEYVVVEAPQKSARLAVRGCSLLIRPPEMTFHIEGLNRVGPVTETLQILKGFRGQGPAVNHEWGQTELRLRECLVALDGHIAGRTYRDMAGVLYGSDRVAETWTSGTRFMKDKVRRAVERGIEFMNGGYCKLLS